MWVDELRYLEVYIVRVFKCFLDKAKKSFYRSANSVFEKIGWIASEEVTLHIVDSKCILMWSISLLKSDRSSLDFAMDRFFMKLFQTSSISIVRLCQSFFLILNYLPSYDGKNMLQNLNRNCEIHRTYSVNCRSILWLMICLTSARGRLLNVSLL